MLAVIVIGEAGPLPLLCVIRVCCVLCAVEESYRRLTVPGCRGYFYWFDCMVHDAALSCSVRSAEAFVASAVPKRIVLAGAVRCAVLPCRAVMPGGTESTGAAQDTLAGPEPVSAM
jgi:hypothetical protein